MFGLSVQLAWRRLLLRAETVAKKTGREISRKLNIIPAIVLSGVKSCETGEGWYKQGLVHVSLDVDKFPGGKMEDGFF